MAGQDALAAKAHFSAFWAAVKHSVRRYARAGVKTRPGSWQRRLQTGAEALRPVDAGPVDRRPNDSVPSRKSGAPMVDVTGVTRLTGGQGTSRQSSLGRARP